MSNPKIYWCRECGRIGGDDVRGRAFVLHEGKEPGCNGIIETVEVEAILAALRQTPPMHDQQRGKL